MKPGVTTPQELKPIFDFRGGTKMVGIVIGIITTGAGLVAVNRQIDESEKLSDRKKKFFELGLIAVWVAGILVLA